MWWRGPEAAWILGDVSGFRAKRAYDEPSEDDGHRILVDRLWPRGLSRERAALDGWVKEVSPSTGLRKWFHAAPEERRAEFTERYAHELNEPTQQQAIGELRALADKETVTLLTGARDPGHSYLVVLLKQLNAQE